ncbi:unnamed protein product [Victoria cruziana]
MDQTRWRAFPATARDQLMSHMQHCGVRGIGVGGVRRSAGGRCVLIHLDPNAYMHASMLLVLFAGADSYVMVENNGCLMPPRHISLLIATSARHLLCSLPPTSYQ